MFPPPTIVAAEATWRVVRSHGVGPCAGDGCPMMCVTGRPYAASTRCGRSIFSQRDMPGGSVDRMISSNGSRISTSAIAWMGRSSPTSPVAGAPSSWNAARARSGPSSSADGGSSRIDSDLPRSRHPRPACERGADRWTIGRAHRSGVCPTRDLHASSGRGLVAASAPGPGMGIRPRTELQRGRGLRGVSAQETPPRCRRDGSRHGVPISGLTRLLGTGAEGSLRRRQRPDPRSDAARGDGRRCA